MGATAVIATGIATIAGAGAGAYAGIKAKERAEDQARETERRTEYTQNLLAERAERLEGRQRAYFAKAGVRVDEDTPLAVIEETRREAAKEIKEVGRRGGYAADIMRSEGSDLSLRYWSQGAGTLLGGTAKTGELYERYLR